MIGGVLVASRMIRLVLADDRVEVEMQVLGEPSVKVFAYEVRSLGEGWFQTFASIVVRESVSGQCLSDEPFLPFSKETDSLQALRLWTRDFARQKAKNLAKYYRKRGDVVSTRIVG